MACLWTDVGRSGACLTGHKFACFLHLLSGLNLPSHAERPAAGEVQAGRGRSGGMQAAAAVCLAMQAQQSEDDALYLGSQSCFHRTGWLQRLGIQQKGRSAGMPNGVHVAQSGNSYVSWIAAYMNHSWPPAYCRYDCHLPAFCNIVAPLEGSMVFPSSAKNSWMKFEPFFLLAEDLQISAGHVSSAPAAQLFLRCVQHHIAVNRHLFGEKSSTNDSAHGSSSIESAFKLLASSSSCLSPS